MKLQLVGIYHEKCAEPQGITWVLAPDDWTDEKLHEYIYKAKDDYLTALEIAKQQKEVTAPPQVYGSPNLSDYPLTTTVAEVMKDAENKRAARQEWDARQHATKATFQDFLKRYGFTPLSEWKEEQCVIHVDWGHRHGLGVHFDETKTETFLSPYAQVNGGDDDDD